MAKNLLNYARTLSSYDVGGPSWGSFFTAPGSYKPRMPFDSSLARLLGMLLLDPPHTVMKNQSVENLLQIMIFSEPFKMKFI